MGEVNLTLNGRDYRLRCDDGQEKRLTGLAAEFGDRLAQVETRHDGLTDSHAMLLTALELLDEFDEARARWSAITPEGAAAEWAADRLNQVSDRIEKVLGS